MRTRDRRVEARGAGARARPRVVGHPVARARRSAQEDERTQVARSTGSEEGECGVCIRQAVGAKSILRRSVEGASRAPWAVCRELREAPRRLGAVDIQLGAGKGSPAQAQRRRLDGHPTNWQARSRQTTGEPQGRRAEIGIQASTEREVVAEHRPFGHCVAFPARARIPFASEYRWLRTVAGTPYSVI